VIRAVIRASAEHRFLVVAVAALAVLVGLYNLRRIPVDALPDLSDTQVIIFSRWDRNPEVLEDQVTYPIVTALLGTADVKTIYGVSDFGFSYVHVIFKDGTDTFKARSRVLECLGKIEAQMPPDVHPQIGPDATGIGWVFQYALIDDSGTYSLGALRSFQDWNLRYRLQSVPGVAEVASIGGFVPQYEVTLDPDRMQAFGVGVLDVSRAVRANNREIGGRVLEFNGREYMVGGNGALQGKTDLESIGIRMGPKGIPVLLKDVARITVGPQARRGVADLDGRGDVVGGIVVMRQGENARDVIRRVKERLVEVAPSLPPGVRVATTYDRSILIERGIDNLRHELILEVAIVSLVILIFLWHLPSAIVPIVTIPVSVLLAFLAMNALGLSSNIMSLSGIAISIGVLVDGAIVEVENAYKKMELWIAGGRQGDPRAVRLEALLEVGPSVFFSLLVIAVAFLPIFALVDQEGRLFKPLAWTKNLTMFIAAFLALTLDPALRMIFTKGGRYYPEERHPVSRVLFALYEPACRFVLARPRLVLAAAALIVASGGWAWMHLGREFMPPLDEGTILYMPTTVPGISVTEARRLLQMQDRILAGLPEVQSVFGKAGRAETSTDPAPLSMMETTVVLRPESQWPRSSSRADLIERMDRALQVPGVTNAWTMPIKGRIDMLATGFRTPVGLKIFGPDLMQIEALGKRLEAILRKVPGTRSVYAERATGGDGVDFDLDRAALARFGLSVDDVQEILHTVVGGSVVGTTTEKRARLPVSIRYPTEARDSLQALESVRIRTASGVEVPLSQLAEVRTVRMPPMIRDENGLLTAYVYVDINDADVGGYVDRARAAVAEQLVLKPGYSIEWSGQYESMLRVRERLKIVVPVTIALIFALLYLNTGSATKAGIVLLAVPFSMVGALWLMYVLGYNLSVASWVGMIALMGLDAETGVFMLLFLDLAYRDAARSGRLRDTADLREAIVQGAVKRVRPKMMTVTAAFMGLMPIMASMGTGADVMKRVAAPMVGGLATSFLLELLVYPAVYLLWRRRQLPAVQSTAA
jgi:Cu(I)/Ag(I) efflux system membrane protein CusA/SilA